MLAGMVSYGALRTGTKAPAMLAKKRIGRAIPVEVESGEDEEEAEEITAGKQDLWVMSCSDSCELMHTYLHGIDANLSPSSRSFWRSSAFGTAC